MTSSIPRASSTGKPRVSISITCGAGRIGWACKASCTTSSALHPPSEAGTAQSRLATRQAIPLSTPAFSGLYIFLQTHSTDFVVFFTGLLQGFQELGSLILQLFDFGKFHCSSPR